jgi:hypothetical protein
MSFERRYVVSESSQGDKMNRIAKGFATTVAGLALVCSLAPQAHADDASSPLPVSEPVAVITIADTIAEATKSTTALTTLQQVQAAGSVAIGKRQATLADLTAKLSKQTKDCGTNAATQAELARTISGLSITGSSLAVAPDIASAKLLYTQIFEQYRVYLLVVPKVMSVLRCDTQLQRNDALSAEAAKLQTQIDALKLKGVDVSVIQTAKNNALNALAASNPVAALGAIASLVPDKGDAALQASNTAALKNADALLDANLALQKNVNAQLDAARRAWKTLNNGVVGNRDGDKDDRDKADKADKEDKKAQDRADKEAKKAEREAQKAADRAAREAKKAEDRAQRNGRGRGNKD